MEAIQSKLDKLNLQIGDVWQDSLSDLQRNGGELCLGWPYQDRDQPENHQVDQQFDQQNHQPFFTWFPGGRPRLKSTAIVSSRLGRKLDRKDAIFRVLRSACAQLDPRCQMLISAEGTTMHPFVQRASELFGIPLMQILVAKPTLSLDDWFQQMRRLQQLRSTCMNQSASDADGTDEVASACYVSPPLNNLAANSQPIRDRIVVQHSDQLLVLHARQQGNLVPLIFDRLRCNPAHVFLALGDNQLVPSDVAESLMQMGAVGWLLMQEHSNVHSPSPLGTHRHPPAPVISRQNIPAGDYLTHCTRRAKGPWPDQTEDDFLNELILGAATRDRSSLAAITRIVAMQTLIASGDSIRDNTQVVSFTAATLDQIQEMRTFRPHRGRWDFEPYGISIRTEVLQQWGVREVVYGDDAVWQSLAKEQRPFFQKTATSKEDGIDWSIEQEWRTAGSVALQGIAASDAIVFVPNVEEANLVAPWSRWPVVSLDL